MEARIVIADTSFDKLIKGKIDESLEKLEVDKLIERKLEARVDKIINSSISEEKRESYVRDRISRIITTEVLKEHGIGLGSEDVFKNLESKLILMISNSKEFKTLVKQTLKSCL